MQRVKTILGKTRSIRCSNQLQVALESSQGKGGMLVQAAFACCMLDKIVLSINGIINITNGLLLSLSH